MTSASDDLFNMTSEFRPLSLPTANLATSVPERCPILSVVPLTEGEWEVSKKDVWIDKAKR